MVYFATVNKDTGVVIGYGKVADIALIEKMTFNENEKIVVLPGKVNVIGMVYNFQTKTFEG